MGKGRQEMGIHIQSRLVPDPSMTGTASCAVADCEQPASRKGLCPKHYWRLQHHGDPLKTVQAGNGEIGAWVAAHVEWADAQHCLVWPFGVTQRNSRPGRGYPVAGRKKGHVVMCEAAHGPAPEGRSQVAHSCDNRMCVNPNHLRWATHQENMDDMVARRRARQGEDHAKAKLNEQAVREILATPRGYGVTKTLAQKFGVKEGTIAAVRRGQTWKSVQ